MNAVSVVGAAPVGVAASAVAAPAEVTIPAAKTLAIRNLFVVHITCLPAFIVMISAVECSFVPPRICVTE